MKKKTRKRSLCLLLAAALLLTSIPFDMTTSSKAEEKGTVVTRIYAISINSVHREACY